MEGDVSVTEESRKETSTDLGRFAVMASLAINLAGAVSPIKEVKQDEMSAAERFVLAWGDCIDE